MKGFTSYFLLFFHLSAYFISNTLIAQPVQQEWVARYQRPQNSGGFKNYLALDKLGNVYVCGQIYNNSTLSDIVLIKYNSFGDTLWTRTYNNPSNDDDLPSGLAVDSIGNAYVTGTIGNGPYSLVTVKYSPAGNLQWTRTYAGNSSAGANDIKLDNQGNIYVTGAVGTGSFRESVTIKYNSNGDSLWVRLKQLTGYMYYGLYVALDNNSNAYTGIIRINTSTNLDGFLVVKYDTNGNEQLTAVHNNNSGFNTLSGLALDNSGNSFIAGTTLSGYTTIKFDSQGIEQWTRTYTNGIGEYLYAIAISINEDCYVTGLSSVSGSNTDYLTIKYNTNGDSLWIRRYNGPGNGNDEAYDLAVDDSANAYITGRSTGTGTSWDFATLKYDATGSLQWTMRYNNISVNAEDVAYEIALDNNRSVFVTGISRGISNLLDYVTIKYTQPVGIINVSNELPDKLILYQNFPNPFNPKTKISFALARPNKVNLSIYDINGKLIGTIINTSTNAGIHEITFDGSKLTSGIYFYTLTTSESQKTRKMILLK